MSGIMKSFMAGWVAVLLVGGGAFAQPRISDWQTTSSAHSGVVLSQIPLGDALTQDLAQTINGTQWIQRTHNDVSRVLGTPIDADLTRAQRDEVANQRFGEVQQAITGTAGTAMRVSVRVVDVMRRPMPEPNSRMVQLAAKASRTTAEQQELSALNAALEQARAEYAIAPLMLVGEVLLPDRAREAAIRQQIARRNEAHRAAIAQLSDGAKRSQTEQHRSTIAGLTRSLREAKIKVTVVALGTDDEMMIWRRGQTRSFVGVVCRAGVFMSGSVHNAGSVDLGARPTSFSLELALAIRSDEGESAPEADATSTAASVEESATEPPGAAEPPAASP